MKAESQVAGQQPGQEPAISCFQSPVHQFCSSEISFVSSRSALDNPTILS